MPEKSLGRLCFYLKNSILTQKRSDSLRCFRFQNHLKCIKCYLDWSYLTKYKIGVPIRKLKVGCHIEMVAKNIKTANVFKFLVKSLKCQSLKVLCLAYNF